MDDQRVENLACMMRTQTTVDDQRVENLACVRTRTGATGDGLVDDDNRNQDHCKAVAIRGAWDYSRAVGMETPG